ncbi:MAG: hypothetical protein JWQ94_3268 [Tardiphaga sp.]|nr:hypothetical protein [Tardiphaga sp.]
MLVPLNSVQLNIVTVLDVDSALVKQSLDGGLFMMDNSVDSDGSRNAGQGTVELCTVCTQGQVINWIIYPMASTAAARISQIQFIDHEVCGHLQIYGAPAVAVSPPYLPGLTPVYDYWAGLVLPDLRPGRYHYQLQVQIGDTFLSVATPSLNVASL